MHTYVYITAWKYYKSYGNVNVSKVNKCSIKQHKIGIVYSQT